MARPTPSESSESGSVQSLKLAQILGLSEQELVALTKAGVLKRSIEKRNGRDRIVYAKDENIERYIRHLREPAERAREEFLKEKRDTARIVREHKELDLAYARGDVLKRDAALMAVMNMLSIVKNQVLTIPTRCTRLVLAQTNPSKVREILKTHCALALRSAIDFNLESALKGSKNGDNADDEATRKRQRRVDSRRRRG
jgi:hypothetical protein